MLKLVRATRTCPNGTKWRICKDTSRCAYILFGRVDFMGSPTWVVFGEFDRLKDAILHRRHIITAEKRKAFAFGEPGEVPF